MQWVALLYTDASRDVVVTWRSVIHLMKYYALHVIHKLKCHHVTDTYTFGNQTEVPIMPEVQVSRSKCHTSSRSTWQSDVSPAAELHHVTWREVWYRRRKLAKDFLRGSECTGVIQYFTVFGKCLYLSKHVNYTHYDLSPVEKAINQSAIDRLALRVVSGWLAGLTGKCFHLEVISHWVLFCDTKI